MFKSLCILIVLETNFDPSPLSVRAHQCGRVHILSADQSSNSPCPICGTACKKHTFPLLAEELNKVIVPVCFRHVQDLQEFVSVSKPVGIQGDNTGHSDKIMEKE